MLNYVFFQLNTNLDNIVISKCSGRSGYCEGRPLYKDFTMKKDINRKKLAFRLTRNIKEFIGFQGLHGSFPLCFYSSIMAIKKKKMEIKNFLNLAISDDFFTLHVQKKNRNLMEKNKGRIKSEYIKENDNEICKKTLINEYIKCLRIDDIEKRNILKNAENYVSTIFGRVQFLYKNKLERRKIVNTLKSNEKSNINVYEYFSDLHDITSLSELSSDNNNEYINYDEVDKKRAQNVGTREYKRKKKENVVQQKTVKEEKPVNINMENVQDIHIDMDEENSKTKECTNNITNDDIVINSQNDNNNDRINKLIDMTNIEGVKEIKKGENNSCNNKGKRKYKKNITNSYNNDERKNVHQLLEQRTFENIRNEKRNIQDCTEHEIDEEGMKKDENSHNNYKHVKNYDNNKYNDEEKNMKYKKIKNISVADINKSVVDLMEMSMDKKNLKNAKRTWFPWF